MQLSEEKALLFDRERRKQISFLSYIPYPLDAYRLKVGFLPHHRINVAQHLRIDQRNLCRKCLKP
jgi:hypothetical protein